MSSYTYSTSFQGFLKPAVPNAKRDQSFITHGDVYCGKDFWSRSAVWFAIQKQKMEQQKKKEAEEAAKKAANKTKKTEASRWASTAVPTRIQPTRAAKAKNSKRKADEIGNDENNAAPAVCKKTKTSPASNTLMTEKEGYTLDPAFANISVHTFQEKMDTLLEGKRASLARSCFWSTAMAKPPTTLSTSCTNRWCPIVAAPLSCNDNKYCSHGMSLFSLSKASATVSLCPVAMMTPPRTPVLLPMGPPRTPSPTPSMSSSSTKSTASTMPTTQTTPPPMASFRFQAKPIAEQQHIQARMVEFAGLRFAVDMCNGMLRVYMV
ncbi:hypothetical protein SBRCBS47491_003541 [Sporothrix bragantina]|uniref:Uncharacterized protein n=1 Tax=Sporothrix bragantina TaxID=671064 RepID=A0ABP0BG24_9PEZI